MTGASHSSVKRYRELARNPPQNGLERELLLEGPHLLFEARKSGVTVDSAAFEQDVLDDPSVRKLAEQLVAEGADVFIVSRRTLESMSPVKTPAGAVGIARRSLVSLERALAIANPLIVVAHEVQDPGNVGGIMRTAEAAGATAFIATQSTADPLGLEGAPRLDGQRPAPADRTCRNGGNARRASQGRHHAGSARAAPRRAAVQRRFQGADRADPRWRRAWTARRYRAQDQSARIDPDERAGRVAQRRRGGSARSVSGAQAPCATDLTNLPSQQRSVSAGP